MNTIFIASFDIGKKNFAFCIEQVDMDALTEITNLDKHRISSEYTALLDRTCKSGRLVLLEHKDLTDGASKTKHLDQKILLNLTEYLDSFSSYWDRCAIFLIEQQMGFGKRQNTMALKIGQHCTSYFLIRYASFRTIIEFPSYHKTKVLMAPPKLSKHARKKWSIEKALEILNMRGDIDMMNRLTSKRKRDDCADVITQLQAFKWLYFIEQKSL